jgi:hypothetical protein
MRHLYITLSCILFAFFSFAAPVNTVITNNGKWSQTTTWSLGRLPVNEDTIVVPKDYTLILDNNLNISSTNFYIKIYGVLSLNVGILNIGENSIIAIYGTGFIESEKSNNADKIQIGGVAKYVGSGGTVFGPATASKTTGPAPYGFSSGSVILPVKFIGFNLAHKGSDVLIQWSTSEEMNAFRYELERSFDAINWNTITFISAVGNSATINNYSYTDKGAGSKTVYYRVKQVDRDGKSVYTAVRSIKTNAANADIQIAAAQKMLVLQFPQQVNSVSIRVVSLNGRVVKEQRMAQAVGQVVLNTGMKGNYVVSVTNGSDVNVARQVIL